MKTFRRTFAAVLAASVLVLSACSSQKRDFTHYVSDSNAQQTQSQETGKFSFSTTDADGKAVTMEDYSSAKVVMFNMWEPWCGPCRAELPDLQKLYEKYRAEGLMIVGVFSESDGVSSIIKEDGLQYPMIVSCAAFDKFQTGYVPTTFFTDGSGNVLSEQPYVDSKSYEQWESVILSYLR